jgi:hypothetical protein
MENTKQTPERLDNLKKALQFLNTSGVKDMKPQQRTIFLGGFCLGKWDEDIIYQMSYSFGRDILTQIENFLKEHDYEY